MARRFAALAMLVPLVGLSVGCSTAMKEGFGAYKGASGVYMEIQPVAPVKDNATLAGYGTFELDTIQDDFAGKVPAGFWNDLTMEFPKQIAAKLKPSVAGKTLIVRGKVIYFELRGSALGLVLGDVEEVVARLELADKDSGKVLGAAMCVGRTTDRVNFGIRKKAEGLSKAASEWIAAYYPKPSKEE